MDLEGGIVSGIGCVAEEAEPEEETGPETGPGTDPEDWRGGGWKWGPRQGIVDFEN